MIAKTPETTLDSSPWFAFLPYPVDALSYEDCEDPDIALDVLEQAHETYVALRALARDGWTWELHWREDDDAFYQLRNATIHSADEATRRLKKLGVHWACCIDIRKLGCGSR